MISSIRNTMKAEKKYRSLTEKERDLLTGFGCSATDWNKIRITGETDLNLIRNVEFEGNVSIGRLDIPARKDAVIKNVTIADCSIGDDARIVNVGRKLQHISIGNNVTIENVAAIVFTPNPKCGVGSTADVLDETGSRKVIFYPGLSAQLAELQAKNPQWAQERFSILAGEIDAKPLNRICDEAVITDSGVITDVFIDRRVRIEGALRLTNGSIINNAPEGREAARVGAGVDAANFIIEDGVADDSAVIRNSYIGQGAELAKNFTSHDSLFFANSSMENGEACAILAGPYTVSKHKSTLLIAAQFSFMNAGSATNQSNHMYKLGPVHWGICERGVKTASSSYVMWGARIGAFSLLMGAHKTHPDTSQFPFSYLFANEKGETIIVPGMMLRSCGLLRDEKKWPKRDLRLIHDLPLHDRVTFPVFNPYTIGRIVDALRLIPKLMKEKTPDVHGQIRYRNTRITGTALERSMHLYSLAVQKYIADIFEDQPIPEPSGQKPEDWLDIAGQVVKRSVVDAAMKAESIEEIERIFNDAYQSFDNDQRTWIANALGNDLRYLAETADQGRQAFMKLMREDSELYAANLRAEEDLLAL